MIAVASIANWVQRVQVRLAPPYSWLKCALADPGLVRATGPLAPTARGLPARGQAPAARQDARVRRPADRPPHVAPVRLVLALELLAQVLDQAQRRQSSTCLPFVSVCSPSLTRSVAPFQIAEAVSLGNVGEFSASRAPLCSGWPLTLVPCAPRPAGQLFLIFVYLLLNFLLIFLGTEGDIDWQAHHAARLTYANIPLVIGLAGKNNVLSKVRTPFPSVRPRCRCAR